MGTSPGPGQGQGGVKPGRSPVGKRPGGLWPVSGIQFAHPFLSQKLFWLCALDVIVQDSSPEELATRLSALSPGVQIPICPGIFLENRRSERVGIFCWIHFARNLCLALF